MVTATRHTCIRTHNWFLVVKLSFAIIVEYCVAKSFLVSFRVERGLGYFTANNNNKRNSTAAVDLAGSSHRLGSHFT